MININLPKNFINKIKKMIPENEVTDFLQHLCEKQKSIKVNTLKFNENVENIDYFKEKNIKLKKIDYIKEGYVIEDKVIGLGTLLEQYLGYFQIQSISSMLPPIILNPNQEDIVLDMTASPGNKTIMLSELMNNKSLIFANDIDKQRIKKLKYTLKKHSITNVIVTNQNAENFKLKNIKFDKILLDAPCSCEGMVYKKKDVFKEWSEKLVNGKACSQKKMITNAFDLLKDNGILVYSTCTFSVEENEEVIDFLLKKNKNAQVLEINLKINGVKPAIIEYDNKKYNEQIKKAIRFWPHKTNTPGFFICKIKKVKTCTI